VGVTARLDEHSEFGQFGTGRLTFAFRPDPTLTLRGALASGYRAPSIDELYGDYATSEFVGNPDLDPETSVSAEVGVDKSFASGASVSATLFAIDIEDEVVFAPCPFDFVTFTCVAGTISTLENQRGLSHRRGLELSAQAPVGEAVTLFGTYTYIDAENADGTQALRVPRHTLLVGAEAVFGDWTVIGTAQHVADFLDIDETFAPAPMEDYTVANLTVTYALTDAAEAYLRVENLFDEDYQTLRGYGQSDRAVFAGLRARF
jgi:vitamin B12 transporter